MHEWLWAGADLKLRYGFFHLSRMELAIQPPEPNWHNVAVEVTGAILSSAWQQSVYADFDAFLMNVRSIPEILRCCFGVDRANKEMQDWFDKLPSDERNRRKDFNKQFKSSYDTFRALPLSSMRHNIEHRSGVAPVEVAIVGRFGVIHVGGPGRPIPISETRQIDDPNLAFLAKAQPVRPMASDFTVDGKPLFQSCRVYLGKGQTLIAEARSIASSVHGANSVSRPPA